MIAVDEFVKMVGYSTWIIFTLVAANVDANLIEYSTNTFCWVVQVVATYGVTYSYLGNVTRKVNVLLAVKKKIN